MPVLAPFSFIKEPGSPPVDVNLFSLLFNGSSQYGTLPGIGIDPNFAFTIEAWVKLSSNNTSNFLFAAVFDSQNYWGFVARNDGNGLCFQEAIASASATFICSGSDTVSVSDGWTHVAVTFDGIDDWNIFKNGILLKNDTNSDTGYTTDNQQIASLLGPFSNYYAGKIDEMRVWSEERSAGDIFANMDTIYTGAETNLKGYWRFENGAGSTATDDTGSNDMTLIGTPVWSADTPF